MGVVTNFSNNVDTILAGVYAASAHGMASYIMPVAWVTFGMGILVWAFLALSGTRELNITQGAQTSIFIIIVLAAASGKYISLVADPLFNMPNQITAAMSGATVTPEGVLDNLADKLVSLCSAISSAMGDSFKTLNIGQGIVLFFVLIIIGIVSILMMTGAIFIYLYAKIGLTLVLAVGPFFIVWLAWAPTRGIFWPWLNTALYLIFTYVLGVMFINLFIKIVDKYITALMTAMGTSDINSIASFFSGNGATLYNVLGMAFDLSLISLPMFFLLLQIPSIAQSMTSGGGGAFGNGMMSIINNVRGGGRGTPNPTPTPESPTK